MNKVAKMNMLRQVANALDNTYQQDQTNFFAEDVLNIGDISIEVDGVGKVSFPIAQSSIEKLISVSSKAHFGSGERTLLDEKVRNTYEITSDKLHVSINKHTFDRLMGKMCKSLELVGCDLIPHLHNMLIYGAGHFFDVHQDSEKLENMVATLVVVLPNSHIGGDLVITHGKNEHAFSSESIEPVNAKCIGFYADCKHKVEKIKEGYRLALTYNLVLKPKKILPSSVINRKLLKAVKEYFELKEDEPKLVYFLNHTYTEHGLRWDLLKGEDRTNCSMICSVAKKLNLIFHLVLVDIHECWYAEDPGDPDYLVFDDIDVSFWIDSNNKKLPYSQYSISNDYVCSTKGTRSFEPYNQEYEGYTGNEGNSLEYWYRRAAIVLWPESKEISMKFNLGFQSAFNELYDLSKAGGNQNEVMEIIEKAGNYFPKAISGIEKSDIPKLVSIAIYIGNSDVAFSILSHLKWTDLCSDSDIAELLVRLHTCYSTKWCIKLLNNIETNSEEHVLNEIDFLIQSFLENGGDAMIANFLLNVQCKCVIKETVSMRSFAIRSALPKRIQLLGEAMKACVLCSNMSTLPKLVQSAVSFPEQYPLASLTDLLQELYNTNPEGIMHYQDCISYLIKTIDHRIKSQMPEKDDLSVMVQIPCVCKHCEIVVNFLHSKTQKKKIWPLKEKIRKHIMHTFSGCGLPLSFSVERTGLPHKLILVKTDELYKKAVKEYEELKLCQQKLRSLNT